MLLSDLLDSGLTVAKLWRNWQATDLTFVFYLVNMLSLAPGLVN